MGKNVFADLQDRVYPFKFAGELQIEQLMGGTPSDPKVAEGWLKSRMGIDKDDILQEKVAEVMAARQLSEAEALDEVTKLKHLNGFKRERCSNCPPGALCASNAHQLFIEGRHLKAGIKEAASVARSVDNLSSRYGATNKGTLSFVAEHIVVQEDRLYLYQQDPETGRTKPVMEPTGVQQSFPRNPITRQTGIQYTEYVTDAIVAFTILSDYEWTREEWGAIWLTGGNQGIGASRSQGYGRYTVRAWDMIGTGVKDPIGAPTKTAATRGRKKADSDTDGE
jgi:hypothetical protein